jgi:DnaK suppressor protein
MQGAKIEQFRQRLLEMDHRLMRDMEELERETADSPSRRERGREDGGDGSTDQLEQDLSLMMNDQKIRVEIEGALRRMDSGKYGLCESCGQEIAEARLEALPFARTCISCAS